MRAKSSLGFFLNVAAYVFPPVLLALLLYWHQTSEFFIRSAFAYFLEISIGLCLTLGFLSFIPLACRSLRKRPYSLYLSGVVTFFALSFAFDLNAFGLKWLNGPVAYLDLKQSKLVLDKRYNCLNCPHSLQKGDVIFTTSNTIGKILGLPGDRVTVNQVDREGRSVASTQEITLSENQIAFLTQGGQRVWPLETQKVRGRFIIPR